MATLISWMALDASAIASLSDTGARLNKPAAIAASDLDSTHFKRIGMTPSARVRSSRMYFVSSEVNSFMRSSRVAVSKRLRCVRMLLAETILLLLDAGIESTEIRSAWLASFFFILARLLDADTTLGSDRSGSGGNAVISDVSE